jgi:hypothetical protein
VEIMEKVPTARSSKKKEPEDLVILGGGADAPEKAALTTNLP